jgi:hypothetical protein
MDDKMGRICSMRDVGQETPIMEAKYIGLELCKVRIE